MSRAFSGQTGVGSVNLPSLRLSRFAMKQCAWVVRGETLVRVKPSPARCSSSGSLEGVCVLCSANEPRDSTFLFVDGVGSTCPPLYGHMSFSTMKQDAARTIDIDLHRKRRWLVVDPTGFRKRLTSSKSSLGFKMGWVVHTGIRQGSTSISACESVHYFTTGLCYSFSVILMFVSLVSLQSCPHGEGWRRITCLGVMGSHAAIIRSRSSRHKLVRESSS
ncbi:unnamed protein product [Ectocarpus sp. 12 AP-2014]